MALTQEELWLKAERDGICDVALLSQTKPNELHRAKKTLNEAIRVMKADHKWGYHPGVCEVCEFLKFIGEWP